MTIIGVCNSILMILGPSVVTYFAFEINRKEDGLKTFLTAGLLNLGTQALILISLAIIAPVFIMDDKNTPLVL